MLPYAKEFDPSEISQDELPVEDSLKAFVRFTEKHGCQICKDKSLDKILRDSDTNPEANVKAKKFLVYRLPFMEDINGKQACPECVEAQKEKEALKEASGLITKTDAMKLYKLSKDDIESLPVQDQSRNSYGTVTSLYEQEDCEKLGAEKAKEKAEQKQKKEETSNLITKTEAMKLYKLSKEDIESLQVQDQSRKSFGTVFSLYKREDCEKLGAKKAEEKAEQKQKKEEEASNLVTKTEAMKLYKLSKDAVESLPVREQSRNSYGTVTSLYQKEDCEKLGAEMAKEKAEQKQKKEEEKAAKEEEKLRAKEEKKKERERTKEEKEKTKAAKSPSKSSQKRPRDNEGVPNPKAPAKRGGKTVDTDEAEEDEEGMSEEEDEKAEPKEDGGRKSKRARTSASDGE